MEENVEKNLNNKKKNYSSAQKPKKKSQKKKPIPKTTLSNDELLEEILKKKKSKRVKETAPEKIELPELVDNKEDINKEVVVEEKQEVKQEEKVEKEHIQEILASDTQQIVIEEPEKKVEEKVIVKEKSSFLGPLIIAILAFILGVLIGYIIRDGKVEEKISIIPLIKDAYNEQNIVKKEQEVSYNNCLKRPMSAADETVEIREKKEELDNYLSSNYKASVLYLDQDYGFTYLYNPEQIYYAASSIKIIDALYIYDKAINEGLDLNTTVKYTMNFKWSSSKGMASIPIGTDVSLRDLVKYAITVSDNSAHQMLVSYIGKNTLKEYGKTLGATKTLAGGDNFGNINVYDALAYLKKLDSLIKSDETLGKELQSYFLEAEQNDLAFEGISAAHKYGEYSPNYHDIGIVYAEHPYYAAILTREFGNNMENKIKDINVHLYELHQMYYANRESACKLEVYGE